MLTETELAERQAFRERYEDLTAGDGVPRSLTREEAIAYLTYDGEDNGLRCFSHWGSTTADCAPVAYWLATVYEHANGATIDPDSLDSCMSMVVNSHGDVNGLLVKLATPEMVEDIGDQLDYFTESLSSNRYSTDAQAVDAMSWLERVYPGHHAHIVTKFPEYERATMGEHSSWFDTEAMGVDPEWGSWLVDAIEATGVVCWQDGEPWGDPRGEDA
jgi:hypothetical protein